MKSEVRVPLKEAVIILVLATIVTVIAVGVGSYAGFAARDTEVDGWRQAYKKLSEATPEWIEGVDKKYGPFVIVTFDRGKNYYAAVRKNGQVFIINRVENVYPGLLAKLDRAKQWQTLPNVNNKKRRALKT
ncbi:MAG: hypothetical protein Q7R54_02760 [bacterium]|nr:hypothetical protein [bacterium]